MYDFYFGTDEAIHENEEKYLLSIKRMLPKWMNSIPDSEFIALHRLASTVDQSAPVYTETGVGASTIVLLFNAMKRNGKLYSWDTNSEKASQIRIACVETIARYLKCDINKHWNFVNYLSTSPYIGIPVLHELNEKVDFFFHDSEHVLDVVLSEIKSIVPLMRNKGIICMDDANYSFLHTNTGFINVVRAKLSLKSIPDIENNTSDLFYKEVEKFLVNNFKEVEKIDDSYKTDYKTDIFLSYFGNELSLKAAINMENIDKLEHRFDAWRVKK